MRSVALGFLFGAMSYEYLSEWDNSFRFGIALLALLGLVHNYSRFPAAIVLGHLWAQAALFSIISAPLPVELEQKDILIRGTVVSIPERRPTGERFRFRLQSMGLPGDRLQSVEKLLRITWYWAPVRIRAGDHWQFRVRLKRPHGMHNPGGFDYEGWLIQQRIWALASVRRHPVDNFLIGRQTLSLPGLRQSIAQRIDSQLNGAEFSGMLTALAVGDRQGIGPQQWTVLRQTGTNHLMAISGLHIGLVAGFAFFIGRFIWSRIPHAALYYPSQKAAAIMAGLCAAGYAALAGFALPTQRAFIMSAVVLWAVTSQRNTDISVALAIALLLVLSIDPLAVKSAGFWLSFAAVLMILYTAAGRIGPLSKWRQTVRVQWGVAIGLIPLTIVFFGGFSLLSPIANAIAIPWVSVTVVPLVLSAVVLDSLSVGLSGLLLHLAEFSLSTLWSILQILSDWNTQAMGSWNGARLPGWALLSVGVGVLLVLAPVGLPGKGLALVWLLPIFTIQSPRPAYGELNITLLDVGQGLAVVAQTQNHVLLYGSGPRYSDTMDAGNSVILPYLYYRGIDVIDILIIGQGENAYIGGAQSLIDSKVPVRRIITGVAERFFGDRVSACRSQRPWQWDGVEFMPLNLLSATDDTDLCVLQIQSHGLRLLLSGPVGPKQQAALVANYGTQLYSQVLVVPPYAGDGRATIDFVGLIKPKIVLHASNLRSRTGSSVAVAGYRAQGAQVYESARHGAVELQFKRSRILKPRVYRSQR